MREIFTNTQSIKILLLLGIINSIFLYFGDTISIKYAKYCAKKSKFNCKTCKIHDCKYRYCGKKENNIEMGK